MALYGNPLDCRWLTPTQSGGLRYSEPALAPLAVGMYGNSLDCRWLTYAQSGGLRYSEPALAPLAVGMYGNPLDCPGNPDVPGTS